MLVGRRRVWPLAICAVAEEDRWGGSGGTPVGSAIGVGKRDRRGPGELDDDLCSRFGSDSEGDVWNCETDARFGMTVPTF